MLWRICLSPLCTLSRGWQMDGRLNEWSIAEMIGPTLVKESWREQKGLQVTLRDETQIRM